MRRQLLSDRGCWYINQTQWWMLDPTETTFRMRPKIKRNYRGSDHKVPLKYHLLNFFKKIKIFYYFLNNNEKEKIKKNSKLKIEKIN